MGSASSKFTSDKKQLKFIKDIKAKKGELKEILKEALKCTKNLNDRMLLKYIAKEKKIVLGNYYIDIIFLYQFLQGRLYDDFDNLMKKYDYVNRRISGKTGKRRNIKVYPTVYLKNEEGEVTGKFELKNKDDIIPPRFHKKIRENYKEFLNEYKAQEVVDSDLKKLIQTVKKANLEKSIEQQNNQLAAQATKQLAPEGVQV